MTTKEAVDHLIKELKNDPSYYHSWKCSIAMAFQDEYKENYRHGGVFSISNMAADRFLKLLIGMAENEADKIEGKL